MCHPSRDIWAGIRTYFWPPAQGTKSHRLSSTELKSVGAQCFCYLPGLSWFLLSLHKKSNSVSLTAVCRFLVWSGNGTVVAVQSSVPASVLIVLLPPLFSGDASICLISKALLIFLFSLYFWLPFVLLFFQTDHGLEPPTTVDLHPFIPIQQWKSQCQTWCCTKATA